MLARRRTGSGPAPRALAQKDPPQPARRPAPPTTWHDFVEFRACCVIGNEAQYRAHVEKQAAGDARAAALLAAVKRVHAVRSGVLQHVAALKRLGLDAAAGLCEQAVAAAHPDIVEHRQWGVCAVTGALCDVCYALPGSPLMVHRRVRHFLLALWLLFHTEAVEAARVADALPALSRRQSTRDLVLAFLRDHADTAQHMAARYEAAEALVSRTLEATLPDAPHAQRPA
jgi:hypothetical protein